jgi:hypothetical protein
LATSDVTMFSEVNGWSGVNADANQKQLLVDGNATDTLQVSELMATGDSWNHTIVATVEHDGHSYDVYNSHAGLGQLIVDHSVHLAWI